MTPEQKARQQIDRQLEQTGWNVQGTILAELDSVAMVSILDQHGLRCHCPSTFIHF